MKSFWKKEKPRAMNDPAAAPLVEIYSKPECHLCEVAKAQLLKLREKVPFELHEVDISKDESLLRRYGERIPLIFINRHLVAKYFIDESRLLKQLKKYSNG